MSSSEFQKRWQSEGYKNYLKAILVLNYLGDGVGLFSQCIMSEFQSEILMKHNIQPKECKTCGIEKGKPQLKCSDICGALYVDILSEHASNNVNAVYWKNTQIQRWSVDAWEIAKVYMGNGQDKDNNGPQRSDTSAILQLLTNCKRYRKYISCEDVKKVLEKRNDAMHSPTLSFTLGQLQDAVTVMMKLLEKILANLPAEGDYGSIKNEMEKTIDILKELMKTEFDIFLRSNEKSPFEEEMKILQQVIQNLENRLNRFEELTERTEVFKVVTPLLEMIRQNPDLMAKLEHGYQTLFSFLSQLEERINATDSRVTDIEEDVASLQIEVESSASKSPDKNKSQGNDQKITVNIYAASHIQNGNNNTMNIYEPRCSKTDSGQPPAPSSSSACYSNGPSGVRATKAPVKKKISVPDKLVDREVMIMVADSIGKEWKLLARRLGLQDSDIDGLNVDHRHLGIREVAYQMLRDWQERRGPEAKMPVLANALVAIKRHDIVLNLTPPHSKT